MENDQHEFTTQDVTGDALSSNATNSNYLSVLIIGLTTVCILVTVLGFWFFEQGRSEPVIEPMEEPEISIATDEVIAAERRSLPVTSQRVGQLDAYNQNQDVIPENQQGVYIPESEVTPIPLREGEVVEAGTETVSDDSSVEVKTVTVTNLAQTGTLETVTRSGVVRTIDVENGSFLIGDPGSDVYQINVTSDTRFWINGQQMSYEQLRRDDIVEVTGQGYVESVKLDAETVTVVGQYKRIEPRSN